MFFVLTLNADPGLMLGHGGGYVGKLEDAQLFHLSIVDGAVVVSPQLPHSLSTLTWEIKPVMVEVCE